MFKASCLFVLASILCSSAAPAAVLPNGVPNLKLWFDGSDVNGDGSIPASGTAVNFWADKSGYGINATNAGKTGGVYVADAVNNHGGVYFGNSDDNWLHSSASSELDFVDATIFMVANDMSSPSHFAVSRDGMRDNEFLIWDGTLWHHFQDSLYCGNYIRPGFTIPDEQYYIQVGIWGQTFHDTTMYLNGTQTDGGTWQFGNGEPNYAAVPRVAYIGQRAAYWNEDFDGTIAELLVYKGKLTWDQQNLVGEYLSEKYGLSTQYTVPEPTSLGLMTLWGALLLRRRGRRGRR
jgi:hypothetical protein